jgi:hypothetical protein
MSGLLADDIERRNIMSTTFALAAATLVAVLAGPALAGDHDLATLLRDSGRYVSDANLPEWTAHDPMANAFASAAAPTVVSPFVPANDFQLQGR